MHLNAFRNIFARAFYHSSAVQDATHPTPPFTVRIRIVFALWHNNGAAAYKSRSGTALQLWAPATAFWRCGSQLVNQLHSAIVRPFVWPLLMTRWRDTANRPTHRYVAHRSHWSTTTIVAMPWTAMRLTYHSQRLWHARLYKAAIVSFNKCCKFRVQSTDSLSFRSTGLQFYSNMLLFWGGFSMIFYCTFPPFSKPKQ